MVATLMDGFSAVNDAAAATDLDPLSDDELDAELVGLLRQRHRLDAEIARRATRWDARVVWVADGSRSAAARLSRDAKLSVTAAREVLRRGRAMGSMPCTAAASRDGRLGVEQVDLLAAAAGVGRDELFARDEATLVEHCATLRHAQAVKLVRYWRQRADAELQRDGAEPTDTGVHLAETFAGAIVGQFTLDPIGGASVVECLRRIERDLLLPGPTRRRRSYASPTSWRGTRRDGRACGERAR